MAAARTRSSTPCPSSSARRANVPPVSRSSAAGVPCCAPKEEKGEKKGGTKGEEKGERKVEKKGETKGETKGEKKVKKGETKGEKTGVPCCAPRDI